MRLSYCTTTSNRSRGARRRNRTVIGLLRVLALPVVLGVTLSAAAQAQAPFTAIGSTFTGAENTVAWGDYNGDNDLDLLSVGQLTVSGTNGFADIYDNNAGTFSAISAGFPQVYSGGGPGKSSAAWGDFDNDGDLDVIITGTDNLGNRHTELYQNTGAGFSLMTIAGSGFKAVDHSFVAWADYDNDGDLDLFLTGNTGSSTYVTTIYRNDGPSGSSWIFNDVTPGLIKVGEGCGAWGDYDNDGDMDLVICGQDVTSGNPVTRLYTNYAGVFVNSGVPLIDVRQGAVAWGDYDNDGDLDLIVSGVDATPAVTSALYENTGGGSFTSTGSGFPAVSVGSIAWGDYNNDGNLDLLATGNGGSSLIAEVYAGNGAGTFSAIGAGLTPVVNGEAVWGDYDNDGLLDIALAGFDANTATMITRVYRNVSGSPADNPPNAPTNLSVTTTWTSITATWSGAVDPETAYPHYNMEVSDLTAGTMVESPMADVSNGYRYVAALGNTDHDLSWTITGLKPGHDYQVCVQAIDGAFAGSQFTCSDVVQLPTEGPDIVIYDCSSDNGSQPDAFCGSVYNSPDIWVRTMNDGFTNFTMQHPAFPGTNYVYVRMTNIGSQMLAAGRVYVYWAKFAAGGQGWSWDWTNCYNGGGFLIGDFVGYADITGLPSGGSVIAEIPWTNGPDPANFGGAVHGCLLARFVAPDDPLYLPEGTNATDNTRNNNNLGWKNFDAVHGTTSTTQMDVGNPYDQRGRFKLSFVEQGGNGSYLNDGVGAIHVTLPSDLYNRWVDNGAHGTGISTTAGSTTIDLLSSTASIEELDFGPRERFTLWITYNSTYNAELAGRIFTWDYTEATMDGEQIGGVTTEIEMPSSSDEKRALGPAADRGAGYELSAQPNPTSGSTVISYLLPNDAPVSIAIYDATGRLVRTVLGATEQHRGRHQIEWNGRDEEGVPVPNGTYFYRLESGTTRMEDQIKITR